jgi:hypothetical protein
MNTIPRLTIALICSVSLSTAMTGCTRPKQTTAIGAAAGTAIGAGLGAIIGNQTGNAGSGVAIGAAAGAATGALVGNVFQKQEESIQKQNESINRQEQMLRAQKSEISELRRMQSDTPTAATGTSTVNAYLVEQKRLQLQRRGPSPRGETMARYSPPPVRSSEPLARYDVKAVPVAPRTSTPPQPKKIAAPVAPAPVIPVVEESTPAKSAAPIQEKDLTEQLKPAAPAVEETTAKLDAAPESPAACDQSSKERAAATAASENSDKLYHLRRALRLCPQSAETHYELGKTYLAMDRAVDATYEFKQALTTDPSFKPAQKELDNLEQNKVKF